MARHVLLAAVLCFLVCLFGGGPAAAFSIQRASESSDGTQSNGESGTPSLSGDGSLVAFVSGGSNLVAGDANNQWDIFTHNRLTMVTELVSVTAAGGQANLGCWLPALSADGTVVAFASAATNLVPADTNGWEDVLCGT